MALIQTYRAFVPRLAALMLGVLCAAPTLAQVGGRGATQVVPGLAQGPGAAWYAPGPLQVSVGGLNPGWKNAKLFGEAHKASFRWRPMTTNPLQAVWQLSLVTLPPDQPGDNLIVGSPTRLMPAVIASGVVAVPASGVWGDFDVDLMQHLPALAPPAPQTYYLRVAALDTNGKPFKTLTGNVALIHKDPCHDTLAAMQGQIDQLKASLTVWSAAPICVNKRTWTHPVIPTIECAPFACGNTPFACRTSCTHPLHCAPGLSCTAEGYCLPPIVDDK